MEKKTQVFCEIDVQEFHLRSPTPPASFCIPPLHTPPPPSPQVPRPLFLTPLPLQFQKMQFKFIKLQECQLTLFSEMKHARN